MQIIVRRNRVIDYNSTGYICMGSTVINTSTGNTFEDCEVINVSNVPTDIDSHDYTYENGQFNRIPYATIYMKEWEVDD